MINELIELYSDRMKLAEIAEPLINFAYGIKEGGVDDVFFFLFFSFFFHPSNNPNC